MKYYRALFILMAGLWACGNNEDLADAYGNFESDEVLVSAETSGKLLMLNVEEGAQLKASDPVGLVDTAQLFLKKEQLKAGINAIISKVQPVQSQINVLTEKKRNILREKQRVERLLADSAATTQQFDEISGQLELVEREIAATRDKLESANRGILAEIKGLEIQIDQINLQLDKSVITNPIEGTVLQKFSEAGEITGFGKPLYKIAPLKQLYLRAYVSGSQLPSVKIGQEVNVGIDNGMGDIRTMPGVVTWISSKAEFTPKVVQTREERVSLVYAIKVKVENDGSLKIGMPGEVNWN